MKSWGIRFAGHVAFTEIFQKLKERNHLEYHGKFGGYY
jgi:hypothetical protein